MENRSKTASLLTAESIMLGVRHEKEGKLRVTYAGWDDAKVVLDGQVLELRWGPQGVEARILPDHRAVSATSGWGEIGRFRPENRLDLSDSRSRRVLT